MSRLRPLDSAFLYIEDADATADVGIGIVAVLAGQAPSQPELIERLQQRADSDPRLRQRVERAPLGLQAPRWVDDPGLDLARHVRWRALPQPRGRQQLCDLIAAESTEKFDRNHPLWRCLVIEEYDIDRWALLFAAHHAMIDGMAGMRLFEQLCDDTDEHPGHPPPGPPPAIPTVTSLASAGTRAAAVAARGTGNLVCNAVTLTRALLPAGNGSLGAGRLGPRRRYGVAEANLVDIRALCAAFGVTVNDVAVAAVTGAVRSVLIAQGRDPATEHLRILVPVSTRPAEAEDGRGNVVAALTPQLPLDAATVRQRLTRVHQRVARQRATGEVEAEGLALGVAALLPTASAAAVLRFAVRYRQQAVGALVTNVIGPQDTLTFLGRAVLDVFALPPLAMRIGLAVAVTSYHGLLRFGVLGDYDSMLSAERIAAAIEADLAEMSRCAGQSDPPFGPP
ncbi:wax ester/triacylglycerol synthase family O-acyltransferase [Nocardia speluncae]|uniref:Diacylglycerol O-acyltransferase n=1 Tax=Nocardia speluncae TaxID=419477 RepID=A0A846XA92_9NOCA|nr:wax ester/triacylglycerol synthase family O-acyltransferase [Nocardia speluncae]NKY32928.1 wax ester/triacylglycerol synthase family O-acyltransferase [Nocardia speluncae]